MMFIEDLWRYPVKSLAGERLDRIKVERFGLKGDRIVHIRKTGHRLITARTHPKLLGLKATLGTNDQPLVSGQPWDSSDALNLIREAAGSDAELAYYGGGRNVSMFFPFLSRLMEP